MSQNLPVGTFAGTYSLADMPQPGGYNTSTLWKYVTLFFGGLGSPTIYMYVPDPINPLTYTTSTGLEITPGKFEFDGASSPRITWWIPGCSPFDKWIKAAAIHDWLYELNHMEKPLVSFEESTIILEEALHALRIPKLQIFMTCYLTRKFGQAVWDKKLGS
jgi:hypothetical protein